MKPLYILITAECHIHGRFQLERKPNKRVPTSPDRAGFYDAVKCPKCPYWATIIGQQLATVEDIKPATDGSAAEYFLPGLGG